MDQIIKSEIPCFADEIFKKVDLVTLSHCMQVSKTWRDLASPIFWSRWQEVRTEDTEKQAATIKAFCHNKQITKVLLHYWSLNTVHETKLLPWAVQHGVATIVQVLLDHPESNSIDFNAKDYFQYQKTSFMVACSFGHFEIVKLLMEYSRSHNIDLNAKDITGKTAFSLACGSGQVETVKCILDHAPNTNLDLNSMDNYGRTALGNACTNLHHYDGCYEVAEILHMLPNIE